MLPFFEDYIHADKYWLIPSGATVIQSTFLLPAPSTILDLELSTEILSCLETIFETLKTFFSCVLQWKTI